MLRRLTRRVRALYRAASASLAWRLVLGSAALVAVALIAAAIALPSLYRAGLERQLDAQLDQLIFNLVGRVEEKSGEITLAEPMTERDFESAYSGNYWQITKRGKLVVQRPRGIFRADPQSVPQQHRPGIEPSVHAHDADAGFRIPGHHSPVDRGRPAPAWQQRGVNIQTALPWQRHTRTIRHRRWWPRPK